MSAEKITKKISGRWGNTQVQGYEIHVGRTEVNGPALLMLADEDGERSEGASSGKVIGTYLHGFFDSVGVVPKLLSAVRPDKNWVELESHSEWRERQLDALSEHLRKHLDLKLLSKISGKNL